MSPQEPLLEVINDDQPRNAIKKVEIEQGPSA